MSYSPAAGVSTGRNAVTGSFHADGYGVRADVRTVADAAMSTGAPTTLTSATANFTSGDIGKLVVVTNAKGTGVHLYGTITARASSTSVTVSASATASVTGQVATYGTDDTTALQNCINDAVAVNGRVYLPSSACAISAALTVNDAVDIEGREVHSTNGSQATHATAIDFPSTPPYLTGSAITVMTAATNALTVTNAGKTFNARRFAIRFAGPFNNTGHGIQCLPPITSGSTRDLGLVGANWQDIFVFGHDGNHYAFTLTNPVCNTFNHLQFWGGGGLQMICSTTTLGNYGNAVVTHLFGEILAGGTAHGCDITSAGGSPGMNLVTMIRPQVLGPNSTYIAGAFPGYGLTGAIAGQRNFNLQAPGIAVFGLDNEQGLGATDSMSGSQLIFNSFSGTGFNFSPQPMIQSSTKTGRRLNDDLSHTLSAQEAAASSWDIFKDLTTSQAWSFATDGTRRLYAPGVLKATGNYASASAGGNAGTAPPVPNLNGTDLAGRVIFGSGTTPAAGAQLVAAFSAAYDVAPAVILTPNNAATQALGLYATPTVNGFTINSANAPSASQAVTTYDVSYMVIGGQAPPVAPAVSDTFTRTDSASSLGTADTGGAWTALSGTWGISTNRAYMPSGATGIAYIDSTRADCKIAADHATVSGNNGGIAFRIVDASNYWLASGNTLWKVVAGSFTNMATYAAFTSGQTMTVVTSGSNITVLRNGVQVASVADAFQSTATKHGLRADNATTRFDNFLAA